MTADKKDLVQYSSAVFTLVAGIALCYVNFLQQGDITNGVLGFAGMCLSFTGGVFGITLYVRTKVGQEVRNYMEEQRRGGRE